MTVQEFYETTNGDYSEIISRLITEDRIKRFLLKFLNTEDFNELKKAWDAQKPEDICITTRNFWRVVNRRFPRSSYNYKINYTCHS